MSCFSEPHKFHVTDQMPPLAPNLRPDLSQDPEPVRLWEEAEHVAIVSGKHTLVNTHSHRRETTQLPGSARPGLWPKEFTEDLQKKTSGSGSLISFEIGAKGSRPRAQEPAKQTHEILRHPEPRPLRGSHQGVTFCVSGKQRFLVALEPSPVI